MTGCLIRIIFISVIITIIFSFITNNSTKIKSSANKVSEEIITDKNKFEDQSKAFIEKTKNTFKIIKKIINYKE